MEIILRIKDFIDYVIHYKDNIEELDSLDRDLENLKMRYAGKKNIIDGLEKENKYLQDRQDELLTSIKEQRKQIRQLKKRDKKLKQIEEAIENKIKLKELKGLINND